MVADNTCRTSLVGVWVAGNVVNRRPSPLAAVEGSAAAIALNADLVDEEGRDAVEEFNRSQLV